MNEARANDIKILSVDVRVALEYMRTVKGNNDTDLHMIEKKLTRNVMLARMISHNKKMNTKLYGYGKLHILVQDDNRITWIGNKKKIPKGWKKDMGAYHRINGLLRIPISA